MHVCVPYREVLPTGAKDVKVTVSSRRGTHETRGRTSRGAWLRASSHPGVTTISQSQPAELRAHGQVALRPARPVAIDAAPQQHAPRRPTRRAGPAAQAVSRGGVKAAVLRGRRRRCVPPRVRRREEGRRMKLVCRTHWHLRRAVSPRCPGVRLQTLHTQCCKHTFCGVARAPVVRRASFTTCASPLAPKAQKVAPQAARPFLRATRGVFVFHRGWRQRRGRRDAHVGGQAAVSGATWRCQGQS